MFEDLFSCYYYDMRKFLRVIFAFLYLCLVLFIKPSGALANNFNINNFKAIKCVEKSDSEITLFDGNEKYYAIIQNNNNTQITNNNKNNDSMPVADGKNSLLLNNDINYLAVYKNILSFNYGNKNTSQNLKNTIYTRAP